MSKEELQEAVKQDILDAKLKKVKKALPVPFLDSVNTASTEELKSIIASCAVDVVQLQNQQDTDAQSLALKQQLEDINGGYKDTRKVLNAKIEWCVHLLESRGDK